MDNPWIITNRADPVAAKIADRHYTRQKIGSRQFVPPGRCLVLVTKEYNALWVTSYPYEEYVKHAWAGAWMCSLFRNESDALSSELILHACSMTMRHLKPIPALGMVTFVDRSKIQNTDLPGYCYIRAGFKHVGFTKKGLYAYQLTPSRMVGRIRNEGI